MEEKILYLQDRYMLRQGTWTCVTVRVQRWYYRGPRVKLTFLEGYHKTSEEIDKAVSEYGKNPHFPDYPKHFEIICSPEDMLDLVKTLVKICETEK